MGIGSTSFYAIAVVLVVLEVACVAQCVVVSCWMYRSELFGDDGDPSIGEPPKKGMFGWVRRLCCCLTMCFPCCRQRHRHNRRRQDSADGSFESSPLQHIARAADAAVVELAGGQLSRGAKPTAIGKPSGNKVAPTQSVSVGGGGNGRSVSGGGSNGATGQQQQKQKPPANPNDNTAQYSIIDLASGEDEDS
eukprot:GDKI01013309.1.p1 GENE.GDKI01013309.1~~GDKI01013309.1.p1  ORF type:complete len:192 (+),score=32.07 GDKI01013309.1:1-576(+)